MPDANSRLVILAYVIVIIILATLILFPKKLKCGARKMLKAGTLFGASDTFPDCLEDKIPPCAPVCGFGTICDLTGMCLGGYGGTSNAHVRLHRDPPGPDSKWQLIPHANGNYYICDLEGRCLTAGLAEMDGWLYHQVIALARPQGRWKFVSAPGGYKISNEMWPDRYITGLHAGLNEPTLQPQGRPNQIWVVQNNACLPPPGKAGLPTACGPDVKSCTRCTGFGTLCDSTGSCLGAVGDRAVRAKNLTADEAQWQLLPLAAGTGPSATYHICNKKDGCLQGSLDTNDHNVYVQNVNLGQPQAQWRASAVGDSGYLLCNAQWGDCLNITPDDAGLAQLVDPRTSPGVVWSAPQCDRIKR